MGIRLQLSSQQNEEDDGASRFGQSTFATQSFPSPRLTFNLCVKILGLNPGNRTHLMNMTQCVLVSKRHISDTKFRAKKHYVYVNVWAEIIKKTINYIIIIIKIMISAPQQSDQWRRVSKCWRRGSYWPTKLLTLRCSFTSHPSIHPTPMYILLVRSLSNHNAINQSQFTNWPINLEICYSSNIWTSYILRGFLAMSRRGFKI